MLTFKEFILEEHGAGEWGTDELVNNYKNQTPGQSEKDKQKQNNKSKEK